VIELTASNAQAIIASLNVERIIRILHVDDDPVLLQAVGKVLGTNREFEVVSVDSVSEALSKLSFGKFDVILSDYQMPQKTGLDFLTELRSGGALTPFILVSEKDRAETIAKALNMGVFRYIEKQPDMQKLTPQLFEAIKQAHTQTQKEHQLQNEELLKQAHENSATGAIIIRAATQRVITANKVALNLFGVTKDQLFGAICQNTICCPPKGQCPILDLKMPATEEEQIISRRDGKQTPVLRTTKKVVVSGEDYIIENFIDLSKIKREINKPQEKSRDYTILFSENPQAIVICDKNFGVVEVNPRFTALFGCSADAVKGQDAINMFTPRNHMSENSWIKQQLLGGHVACQTKRQGPGCPEVNVLLYGSATSVDGHIIGFVLVFQDNTESMAVREELNILIEEQNLSLGKTRLLNEQLNVTSGLTRHDIRNKLTALTFKAYLAKKRSKENPEMLSYLTDIEAIGNNIARLLEFAKTYELLGTQEQVQVNVGKIVADAVSLFVDLKGVTVVNECEDIEVNANSLLLELFHNMIDNSLKYGPPKITEIRIYAGINHEGDTQLVYEDNGNGIDPQIKDRLFEKGVTTKGTGYGLWLIRRICEMYGWSVNENGIYGQGVRFVMTIPNSLSNIKVMHLQTKNEAKEPEFDMMWR
jgi:PAS domain S-box-containing protein